MAETDTMMMARKMRERLYARRLEEREQEKRQVVETPGPTPPARNALEQTRKKVVQSYGEPPRHSAANSHLQNDKYMDDFDKAYDELQRMNVGSGGASGGARPFQLSAQSASAGYRIEPPSRAKPSPTAVTQHSRQAPGSSSSRPSQPAFEKYPGQVNQQWHSGPTDPAGILADISDRPSLCAAANWSRNEIVVGSSDHALYIIDAAKGNKKRTLYSKTCGHTEWVSCVAALPDGKVVSGGMDSKMWMWPSGSTRGIQMDGHSAPISKIEYDPASGGVVSASYDKSVRLWSLGSRGTEAACLLGHDAPVLELGVNAAGQIISGDRSGSVILWDTSAAEICWRMKGVHRGHVTSLVWAHPSDPHCGGLFLSGGQDGMLRVWDPRSRTNPAKVQLHVNEQGHGAVSEICAGGPSAAGRVVTAGADGTCRILDPRKSFCLVSTLDLTNFPYSMATAGGLALVGCGDGALHFIDIDQGTTLYALGAHKGAVRTISACADRIVTSGDDGNTALFHFG